MALQMALHLPLPCEGWRLCPLAMYVGYVCGVCLLAVYGHIPALSRAMAADIALYLRLDESARENSEVDGADIRYGQADVKTGDGACL